MGAAITVDTKSPLGEGKSTTHRPGRARSTSILVPRILMINPKTWQRSLINRLKFKIHH